MTPTQSREFVIAVMGVTGSGKSSLIREITGIPGMGVSDGLNSRRSTPSPVKGRFPDVIKGIAKVVPYTFQHDGTTITLVDTPGFGDTTRSDVEVLEEVSQWVSETYTKGQLLSGILYLRRISDNRMDASAPRSLRLLKSLVGKGNLKNVLLTTTHWSRVTQEEGERLEKVLRGTENLWKELLNRGATLTRYLGDRQSGLELLSKIIPSELGVLDIRDELVDQGRRLVETATGKSVNGDLKSMQGEGGGDEAKVRRLGGARRALPKIESPAKALLYKNELALLPDKEALLIYVKGTMEIGNVGMSGSLLSSMLDSDAHAQLRSKLAIQGVYYNPVKSVFSVFSGGSRRATRGVLRVVREGIKSSPGTRIFLCGYSQGAMIIRRALPQLSDPERARISGLVFFGDPASWGAKLPKTLEGRLLNLRLPYDSVHLPIPVPTRIHFWYGVTFPAAIKFIRDSVEDAGTVRLPPTQPARDTGWER